MMGSPSSSELWMVKYYKSIPLLPTRISRLSLRRRGGLSKELIVVGPQVATVVGRWYFQSSDSVTYATWDDYNEKASG